MIAREAIAIEAWGDDLITIDDNTGIGLESLDQDLAQGQARPGDNVPFKPVNIASENGLFYVTIYVCKTWDHSPYCQALSMWLSSLKETDHIHLTILSLESDTPLFGLINVMSALVATPATLEVHLDTIVFDTSAYFYLLADKINKGSEGALFIPSYVLQREQDVSASYRAMHDFYKWLIESAVEKNILTTEEGSSLNRGAHVVVPESRFITE
jgi:hypothetical protein